MLNSAYSYLIERIQRMIMNKKNLVVIAWLAVSTMMSAQSVYPGQHQGKMKKETVAPIRVQSFDLKDVRLLASRFRDNMLRDSAWMTSLDVNRLLHSFRTNAGVFAGREGGYMTVKNSVAGNLWTANFADILPDICFQLTH